MKADSRACPPERLLSVRLARRRYALRVADISGLAEPGALHVVPLAPAAVLGLVEWRGRLLTVLDLPHLLDDGALDSSASLIRLAPPYEYTALFIPGPVRLQASGDPDSGESVEDELLEPGVLVERVQREILDASSAGTGV